MSWLLRNPLLAGAGLGLLLLAGWLAVEKLAQAATRDTLAEERARHAALTVQRAEAFRAALEIKQQAILDQQAEIDRLRRAESSLTARVENLSDSSREERTAAARRLAAKEAENEALRQVVEQRLPDSFVDWLLEPAADPGGP